MAGIIVIIAGAILFVIAMLPKKKKATMPLNIPDIHKVNSLQDVVMSVNHGRIYPYFTGMSIEKAQKIANDVHPNPTALNQTLQMQELMGIKMFFDVPISNKYIERVSVHLNNNRIISSISIDIKDFHINKKPLTEEMTLKFGKPMSMDNEFIIWRDGWMVVNIHKEGSLCVIDEKLYR